MNDFLNSSTGHPSRQLSIALVVLEGFDFASLSAALEAISTARRRIGTNDISCTTVGTNASSKSSLGISITPNIGLDATPLSEYDVTILVGGSGVTLKMHFELTRQLMNAAEAGRLLGGIWNGAYHLTAAGLTDGYECLIAGDGRFSIEPPISKRRKNASWHFDGRRMTCTDAHSTTCMMGAMFDHFFEVLATGKAIKKKAKPQKSSGVEPFSEAC